MESNKAEFDLSLKKRTYKKRQLINLLDNHVYQVAQVRDYLVLFGSQKHSPFVNKIKIKIDPHRESSKENKLRTWIRKKRNVNNMMQPNTRRTRYKM